MMGFHKTPEGALPLWQQQQGSFPFRGNIGHDYDQWPWLYPAQTNQYQTYFNSWYGNQMPNFSIFVPIYREPQQGVMSAWLTHTNYQQQNALQAAGRGSTHLQFGQQQSANYITSLGKQWSRLTGGGRRR